MGVCAVMVVWHGGCVCSDGGMAWWVGLDKICFFSFLFCFSFMLDKSTYFAFPIHPFCSLFHPFCFPKNSFFAYCN